MVKNGAAARGGDDHGGTTLFMGELHWWTIDADLEADADEEESERRWRGEQQCLFEPLLRI